MYTQSVQEFQNNSATMLQTSTWVYYFCSSEWYAVYDIRNVISQSWFITYHSWKQVCVCVCARARANTDIGYL
jgi:hypothetical protein